MLRIRHIITAIIAIPVVLCIGLFLVSAVLNGFGEALDLTLSAPRNLFCSIVKICEVKGKEVEIVDTQQLWTRIHDRAVLDVGKYETRKDWKAEITTWPVTHSMRMRATVSVTMGINLQIILPEDIVVDEASRTITITLPKAQPVECFLSQIEYHDESCLLVCGDLERELQKKARQSVLDSDELSAALVDAYENARPVISTLISPVAPDYTITFIQSPNNPPPLQSSSCY